MRSWSRSFANAFLLFIAFPPILPLHSSPPGSWSGVLRDSAGNQVDSAIIKLLAADGKHEYSVTTSVTGQFTFDVVEAGNYTLTVSVAGKTWTAADPVVIKDGATLTSGLQLPPEGQALRVIVATDALSPQAT